VVLHGPYGDEEKVGDLAVGEPPGRQYGDLSLAACQEIVVSLPGQRRRDPWHDRPSPPARSPEQSEAAKTRFLMSLEERVGT
jgi:hypothetical protein